MKTPKTLARSILYRMSFARKMVLSFFSMAVIVCLIVGLYSTYLVRSFSKEQAEVAVENVLNHLVELQVQEMLRIEDIAQNIASNTAVVRAVQLTSTTPWVRYINYRDVIDPLLTSVNVMHNEIVSITIYHENPDLSSHGTVMPMEEAPPFIISLQNSKPLECVWYSDGDQLQLGMKCTQGNEYVSSIYVLITLSKAHLFQSLSAGTMNTQFICLTDQNGNVAYLSSESPGLWEESIFETLGSNVYKSCSTSTLKKGNSFFILYHIPLDHFPFVLHAAIPRETFFASTYHLTQLIVLIMVVCLLVMLPLSIVLSKVSVKRIYILNDMMAKVEKGQLDVQISTPYTDEIGVLMKHFNGMVASVKKALVDLQKSEKQQKDAEMQALRAQINPHFLYNTLSLISWKAMEQGASQAAEIARTFSSFCRTVLNRGKSCSSLALEMINVRSYVDIQLDMHDRSFDVVYDVPESLSDIDVPVFILQPLVENAIIHGLETVRGLKGRILIKVYQQQEDIYCCVENNGGTFSASQLQESLSSSEHGYGLRNVQQRVKHLCGDHYGLMILPPDEGYTTCVCLRIRVIKPEEVVAK